MPYATANPKVHGIAVVLNWLLLVAFIAPHALRLGGVANAPLT